MTYGDLCTDALLEIGGARAGDVPAPEILAFVLDKLNRIIDRWNAQREAVYADTFQTFVLTPNLQPHTIGIAANTPTWAVTGNRPQKIVQANLVLNTSTPNVLQKIDVRDAAWWNDQRIPTLATSFPTDVYYEPDWPNGSAYFWPVPTAAYSVRLMLRLVLAQAALTDTLSMPPGYQDALTLTVAEQCSRGVTGLPATPDLMADAGVARAVIFDANDVPRRLRTFDAGMGGRRRSSSRTTFNYRSRSSR